MTGYPDGATDLVTFWFAPEHRSRWFATDPAFDALLRQHFAKAAADAGAGRLDGWAGHAEGWLALLLLLDQCSRNLHRDSARCFAQDGKAQDIALSGLARGEDRKLHPLQRVFAYMPLEHAEDIALQQRSVMLFERLCGEVAPQERGPFTEFVHYARKHRAVIARFGRFPHRNQLLGRSSTAEELEYLAESSGAGF